jgi:uncharacterized secreted protein with C-terminal beta-propeller domain
VGEVLEQRFCRDATLPELIDETGEGFEVETFGDEETSPDVIFYTLGGVGPVSPITPFGSRAELGEYLLERALERYDGLFGQAAWWYSGPVYFRGGVFSAMSNAPAFVDDFSETNTQVSGVDEADVIENDGKHLYLLNGNQLVILQAYPAGEMRELSRVAFEGYPIAEYLDGDRLTVISQEYDYSGEFFGGFLGTSVRFAPPASTTTVVSIFDVSNPSRPSLEKQVRLAGNYVDSRAFNGQVHVITSHDFTLPAPQTDGTTTIDVPIYYFGPPVLFHDAAFSGDSLTIEPTDEEPQVEPGDEYTEKTERIEVPVYESREAYIARVRANLDALIEQALPHYEVVTAQGLAAVGLISEVSAINRVNDADSDSLLSVLTIDTRDPQPGLFSSSSVVADWTNGIFANREHLYVFSPTYSEDGPQTRILEFAWANGEREIQLIGSGVVDGYLHNQYSADEYNGRLRIATTTWVYDSETGESTQANNLVILENIDGELIEVGAVEGFAPGEQIYSVRFDGDRAFVVTFRQIDPLFVFDLSDPVNPVIRGELQVPGFSSYLQLIGENHLLAIGRDTETQSTKVALYDISNPAAPIEVDSDSLPTWTWSQAEWDAQAVGWFAVHNTLAIPTSGWDQDGYHSALSVFRIDVTQSGEAAIEQIGSLEDDGYINRSAFIGRVLYTISSNSVIASDIDSPEDIIHRVDFQLDPDLATLKIQPVYVESDDGAADWEYLNLPESLDEAEGLLALAAVNVLDGTIRVSLLAADSTVTAILRNHSLTLKARGHQTLNIPLGDSRALLIEGTSGADRLNLYLYSSPGSALETMTVNAGAGNDRVQLLSVDRKLTSVINIHGEAGDDRVNVAAGVQLGVLLSGGDGSDSLTGGNGDDTIDGGAGDDSLSGGRGNDWLLGGDGDDVLFGRAGHDTLSGGTGADRIHGGLGNDAIAGGHDDDTLYGEGGNDTLLGGAGNDKLYGGSGNDLALGEEGDDLVHGGPGSRDTLSGGAGDNTVLGSLSEVQPFFVFDADWLDLI